MDRQIGDVMGAHHRGSTADRGWDVMQFEVEKDLPSGIGYRIDQPEAFGEKEFEAYFDDAERLSHLIEKAPSLVGIWNIERQCQAFTNRSWDVHVEFYLS